MPASVDQEPLELIDHFLYLQRIRLSGLSDDKREKLGVLCDRALAAYFNNDENVSVTLHAVVRDAEKLLGRLKPLKS